MIFEVQFLKRHWIKPIVPVVILLILGYGNFVGGYTLGYQQIWKSHSHTSAIIFWVLLAFCQVTFLFYWGLIIIVGPGKLNNLPLIDIYNSGDNDMISPPPAYFPCDQYGFPYFDSHTGSIMAPRSFYLKDAGYIVLKFDHYCVWVGSVIGQNNYLYFMKFIIWFWLFFVLFIVYLSVYSKNIDNINPNLIVAFIICGFWLLILLAFIIVHLKYTFINMTTLDEVTIKQYNQYQRFKLRNQNLKVKKTRIPRKEDGLRYINVAHDNTRLVISYSIHDRIYNMGFKKNWINLIFNGNKNQNYQGKYDNITLLKAFILFLLPYVDLYCLKFINNNDNLNPHQYFSDNYNEEFLKLIDEKVKNRLCYLPLYIKPEQSQ